jgi:hypothetical protein
MKICVYAISKNEEMFVERFCNSAKDADLILIADTGSTDLTAVRRKAARLGMQALTARTVETSPDGFSPHPQRPVETLARSSVFYRRQS